MADAQSKDFEDITSFLGNYGRFQILMMVLLGIGAVPNGYIGSLAVFVSDTPEHRCRAPLPPALNATINGSRVGPDSCSRYRVRGNWSEIGNDTEPCVDGWEYSTDTYISTTVTEWDLVCDNAWKVPLSTSLFFVGVLTGSFAVGHLSDRFGRKPVLFSIVVLRSVTALVQAASVNWVMFCFVNCLRGLSSMCSLAVTHVLGSEMLNKSARVTFSAIAVNLGYGTGYAILPLFAYFIRSWRTLLAVSAIPSILFLPAWWIIPESPRWLLQKGRVEEAELVIRNAAKMNKIIAPEVIFKADDILGLMQDKGEESKTYDYLDLLRTRNLRNIVIIATFIWMSIAMVFYGISLSTSNLHGNNYLNCFFSALIEIITYLAVWLLLNYLPRVTLIFCSMMFGGVMLMVMQLIPEDMQILFQVLALGGKIGSSSGFCLIYVLVTELFPTVVRNMGFGIVCTAGYVSTIICPFIIYTGFYMKSLPFIFFSAFSIVAAALSMLLPETRNCKLPDLISQTRPIRSISCQKEKTTQDSDEQMKV